MTLVKLAVIVTGKTQPGMRDDVRKLEQHLAPWASANPAQEVVVWCVDNADPDAFYLFEVHANPAAIQANAQASWFSQYVAEVGPLLAGQPQVATATPAFTKTVGN